MACLEDGKAVGHEEGKVFLSEGERGKRLSGVWGAEDEFNEGNDGDEGEEVEYDGQHVEEQVGCYVPGIETGVAEYSPDIVHGGVVIGVGV